MCYMYQYNTTTSILCVLLAFELIQFT